jgi:hypothetical protein
LNGNGERIRATCNFKILKDVAKPSKFPLSSGRIVVIGIDLIDMKCNNIAKTIRGCAFYIIEIPSTCEIKSGYQTFFSRSFSKCIDPRKVKTTKRHLLNLVSIRDYSDHQIDKTHDAFPTYEKEFNEKFPEINFSPADSKFQAADYTSQMTMQRLKKKVKNNDKVFQDVYEEMLAGELEVEDTTTNPLVIVQIVMLSLVISLLILFVICMFIFRRRTAEAAQKKWSQKKSTM